MTSQLTSYMLPIPGQSTTEAYNYSVLQCENDSSTIVFHTKNEETSYVQASRKSGSISHLKGESLNMSYNALGTVLDGQQFSSTTIVNGGVTSQNPMEVTTFHVPVMGLEETILGMELPYYDTTLTMPMSVPVETVEVPTMLATNGGIETIQISDYGAVINPSQDVKNQQAMVIASTDSDGNCIVSVQESEESVAAPIWNNEVPVVTQVVQRSRIGRPSLLRRCHPFPPRIGRCRYVVDEQTSIPVASFKAQLSDTSDIVDTLHIAPPTKHLMQRLSKKGVANMLTIPGRGMLSPKLSANFFRQLVTHQEPVEVVVDDMELLPLGYQPEVDPTKIKRITRKRRYPEAEEYQRKMIQQQMQQTFDNLVAESQKNMEAVFLDNSVVNMYSEEDVKDSIIVIHDGEETAEETAYTQQNIEVLLAAAAGSGVDGDNIHQVFICQQGQEPSILLVPNNPLVETTTETVITS